MPDCRKEGKKKSRARRLPRTKKHRSRGGKGGGKPQFRFGKKKKKKASTAGFAPTSKKKKRPKGKRESADRGEKKAVLRPVRKKRRWKGPIEKKNPEIGGKNSEA